MKKIINCFIIYNIAIFLTSILYAENIPPIVLDKAPIHRNNIASIERGAKFFAGNCMACHTLIYLRYDALAHRTGVIYEKMPIHVTTWPLGVKPPDLSLEADIHSPDWIYTYLHSFYVDTKRPTGTNNLVVPN